MVFLFKEKAAITVEMKMVNYIHNCNTALAHRKCMREKVSYDERYATLVAPTVPT